jgi:mRNA interferase RelE/StbE
LSAEFTIAETESFRKQVQKPHFSFLYSKIIDFVYPQLRQNPFFGPNIKKLKGNLSSYYRYRIGNSRLFYMIHADKLCVFIVTIKDRKDAY